MAPLGRTLMSWLTVHVTPWPSWTRRQQAWPWCVHCGKIAGEAVALVGVEAGNKGGAGVAAGGLLEWELGTGSWSSGPEGMA